MKHMSGVSKVKVSVAKANIFDNLEDWFDDQGGDNLFDAIGDWFDDLGDKF